MQQAVGTFTPVSALDTDSRATFIWRVYGHVALAILAFAGIESYLFSTDLAYVILERIAGTSWLLILGAFMVVGWLASHAAHTVQSKPLQYLALGGVVVAWSIIFVRADARASCSRQSLRQTGCTPSRAGSSCRPQGAGTG